MLETSAGVTQRRPRDERFAGSGSGRETGGHIHRVAFHRVGATKRWSENTGEDGAASNSDLDRQGRRGTEDLLHRTQQPIVVVITAPRRTGDDHDPDAVGVDVGLEERDAVPSRRVLN